MGTEKVMLVLGVLRRVCVSPCPTKCAALGRGGMSNGTRRISKAGDKA
jgi:hypothetical protein